MLQMLATMEINENNNDWFRSIHSFSKLSEMYLNNQDSTYNLIRSTIVFCRPKKNTTCWITKLRFFTKPTLRLCSIVMFMLPCIYFSVYSSLLRSNGTQVEFQLPPNWMGLAWLIWPRLLLLLSQRKRIDICMEIRAQKHSRIQLNEISNRRSMEKPTSMNFKQSFYWFWVEYSNLNRLFNSISDIALAFCRLPFPVCFSNISANRIISTVLLSLKIQIASLLPCIQWKRRKHKIIISRNKFQAERIC